MEGAQRNRSNQIIQHPPLPPNSKSNPNYLSPRQPYLSRTNSNSKSFKKTSVEKSIKQKQIQQQIKYAVPNNIEASFERSLVNSQKNFGPILIHGPFEQTTSSFYHTKAWSKSKRGEKQSKEKGDSLKPFDVLSGYSGCQQNKGRDKNEDYYLYWKSKAHQYLESNMKMMQDIRKLTRQNEQLKSRIQILQSSPKSVIKIQQKNSEIAKQAIKKEQNREYNYLLQKMEQMQKELKRKEIVIRSYQQKIKELSSKIVGDNERTRLISKLKSEIDFLKSQLNQRVVMDTRSYTSGRESSTQGKYKSISGRVESKFSNYGRN